MDEGPGTSELEERAARAAGLPWKSAVEQRRLSGPALAHQIEQEFRAIFRPEELRLAGRELEALGLAPPGFDLLPALLEFSRGSTLGFYSSLSGTLFLTEARAEAEGVQPDELLVHELAHALQDQNSAIPRTLLGLRRDDDLAFALSAALEGHALHVEALDAVAQGANAPVAASPLDVGRYREAFPGLPPVLVESSVAVYPLGQTLVRLAHESGGDAGVARVLSDPPLSSEQVLVPEKWLAGPARDLPRFIELGWPRGSALAGCTEIGRNTLGRYALGLWLEERAGAPRPAADGWDGDRYALLDCADGLRIAWAFELDDAASAAALEPLLRAGLDSLVGFAGPVALRRERTRLLATRGFDPAQQRALWEGTSSREFESLAALLAARPEIRERAAGLRARRSDEQRDAHRRGQRSEGGCAECQRQLGTHVVHQVAAREHARQDGRIRDR
jgi:hypothetical protein